MRSNRRVLVVLVIAIIVLGLGAGVAQALPPAQQETAAGLTIPYAGHLTGDAGNTVPDGSYAFTFALYDSASGGTLLWSEVQEGIVVKDGDFVASLGRVQPISAALMSGGERWLEVAVRGPDAAAFTALAPRQQLQAAAPAAGAGVSQAAPCPHDHWGETWSGTGVALALHNSAGYFDVQSPGVFVALLGSSTDWGGVQGNSTNNIGVYGTSTNAEGVYGQSTNGDGGFFDSRSASYLDGDIGLEGSVGKIVASDSSTSEMYLQARGDMTFKVDADNNGTHTFNFKSGTDFSACWIEEDGDLTCSGTKSAVVDTEQYGRRKLYAMESPEVWHEDLGTAALVNGEVTVAFEPVFAQTVNLEEDYHVFVTPLSDEPVWLYVTVKTASGFTVRGVTLDGQPASCAFDYRVVAKRLGYEGVRLAPVQAPEEGQ
jgi:hypothetical protein